jgi:hypothetical protein
MINFMRITENFMSHVMKKVTTLIDTILLIDP